MNNLKTSETNQEFNHETNDLIQKINLAADLGYPCLEDLEDELGTDWEKPLVYDFNQPTDLDGLAKPKRFTNLNIINDQLQTVLDVYNQHTVLDQAGNIDSDERMECLAHLKALSQQIQAIVDHEVSLTYPINV